MDANWRSLLMRSMVQLLGKEKLPIGVRAKFIIACAQSRDPSVAILFQTTCVIPISQFAPIGGTGHWAAWETKNPLQHLQT